MQLFIANPNAQNHVVNARVPEISGVLTMEIPAGQQVAFAGNRLNKPQIDAVIDQMRKYGMAEVGEVSSQRGATVLVCSRDRPVPLGVLKTLIERNWHVKKDTGEDFRKKAAIAADARAQAMAQSDRLAPQNLMEMTVQEVEGGTQLSDDAPVSVGVRVEPDARRADGGGKRRGRNRAA